MVFILIEPEAFPAAGQNYSHESMTFTLTRDQGRFLNIVIWSSALYELSTYSMFLHVIELCTAD